MTVTKDQAQMLATLACDSRPTGARRWNPDDVMAEIAKLHDRSLPAVICAVIRAAMDRGAERPAVICSSGSHWSDTAVAQAFVPNHVDRAGRCSICSCSEPHCRMRWGADHEFVSVATAAKKRLTTEATVAAVAALREDLPAMKPPTPPRTLDELVAENPRLHERVEAVRASLPKPPPQREDEPEEAAQ